ncbi:MAG: O-antigen ligase family protein [Flavobacteriales bacterium]
MMNGLRGNKAALILSGLILVSLLLLPELNFRKGFASFQVIDLLMPLLLIFVYLRRKLITWRPFFSILILFALLMLTSIFMNGRMAVTRDYFEFYKLLKFSVVFLIFSFVALPDFIKYVAKPVFVLLAIVNLFHYFNLFDINTLIHAHYNGGIHIEFFGLNSLGEPGTRRMSGLSGNPNINSIVFGFFAILFIPQRGGKPRTYLWLIAAVFLMFLCQSRTNLIAFVVMTVLTFAIAKRTFNFNAKNIVLSVLAGFLIAMLLLQNDYLNSLFTQDLTKNTSLLGRFEVWKHLVEMIIQKPFFGHGPFKEYFYQNKMYSESEYIMQTWRYGFFGLLVFLGVLLYPAVRTIGKLSVKNNLILFQFTILMAVNSLTNNPFSDRLLMVLFAIAIGLSFGLKQIAQDEK